jgi:hypothetical protein
MADNPRKHPAKELARVNVHKLRAVAEKWGGSPEQL